MKNWKIDFYNNYSKYFKREYTSTQYEKFIPYGRYILNLAFPPDKNIKILDLACGIGGYLKVIHDNGYTNITGVDTSEEEIDFAYKNGLTSLIRNDIFSFLENSSAMEFDIVLALDIIEHFEQEEVLQFMSEANRVLKPQGKLIIHTPNAEAIFGSKIRYADFTHEVAFTQNSIKQVCTFAGFKTVTSYEDRPLLYSFLGFLRRIVWEVLCFQYRLLHAAETGTFKVILSQNFLTIAEK